MHLVAIAAFILLVMLEKCCVFSKIDRSENSGLLGFDQSSFMERSTKLTQLGLEATQKILSGAKKIRSKKRLRRYLKVGDMDTALKDFLSVNPTDLTEFTMFTSTGVKALSGKVGDRKLILINYPDAMGDNFNPVMDIIDVNAAKKLRQLDGIEGGQYGDRIIYKK